MPPAPMEFSYKHPKSNKSQLSKEELDPLHSPSEEKKVTGVPLSDADWICEPKLQSYVYPLSEVHDDPWGKCHSIVDLNDQRFCKQLNQEISWLLALASLFLGIVTGFTNTSFKWLQANPEEVAVDLLRDVVKLLNDPSSRGTVAPPRPFMPKNHHIIVNQLWFLSMILSISAVIVGTLCLQWLSAFRRTDAKDMPHDDALALRQLRFDGVMAWGVPRVPAILLVTVQSALVLFAIGLLYLLWSVNRRVALPVAVVSGVSVSLLALATAMPLLQSIVGWIVPRTLAIPQCPYKSPISWAVHRSCVFLAIICTLPFGWLPRTKKTIIEWQDKLWRQQRERTGPQSSKKNSKGYSYYLVRGLASAMEALVFRNAVNTIHECLQDFHGTDAEVETFEELFSKEFPPAEEDLLQAKLLPPTPTDSATVNSTTSKQVDLASLRRDFLNAHALQHFVAHNQKLHRTLLPHRVELYIRIKNSSLHPDIQNYQVYRINSLPVGCVGGKRQLIGSSIECPIQSSRDAQGMPAKLRIQFLLCALRLLDSGDTEEVVTSAVRHVLEVCEAEEPLSSYPYNDSEIFSQDNDSLPPIDSRSSTPSFVGDHAIPAEPVFPLPSQFGRRQQTMTTIVNDQNAGQSSSVGYADVIRKIRGKLEELNHDHDIPVPQDFAAGVCQV